MVISRRAALLGGLATTGLMVSTPLRASGRISVVATTGMIADTARQIGGDLIDVTALMGPGVDPHAYRQTRSDIVAMTRADLLLWHGLFLEAQMEDFMTKLAKRQKVVAVAEAVPRDLLQGHDDYADKFDPHVWMAPALWRHVAERVAVALSDVAPESREVFEANLAGFLSELEALERYSDTVMATVPDASRVLVTAHDAFGYFGQAYGFEVLGIQGISTESEAGLNRISTLVDTLVDRQIGAVFVESSVSDRNMRALIEGAAAKGHQVRIGGELYSDAMGAEGTYEGTYIGMIDHNISVIASALGGNVPSRGMNGQLTHEIEEARDAA